MILNPAKAILIPSKTALLICDMQEKFAKVIYEFNKIVTHSSKLIQACKILDIPMIVTEQYPKALGKTISELNISGAKGPFPKTQFSMYTSEVCKELSSLCNNEPPASIILIGIESHVCVENTAIDLKKNGFEVHTVADCCSSRTKEDKLLALERMRQIGCFIASSENIIFKLLGDAKHKDFKQIQGLIKNINTD
ncbi:PREDICTED: isochorismatase domain-containing protein 2, mitochondrial-like [Ceratosolen solmsi marchali]|uniref:Isochorismatase domain-containing protein 1 n=1 Tax=Ceratosolen solmsi marchali TaxID=326594 RepID=A0AAJ6YVS7_9HYME|nr:PREDICTED: isochorismatase domain-containing protein 2, mitochondrial-like [Ceratosolen solmsi marchali]